MKKVFLTALLAILAFSTAEAGVLAPHLAVLMDKMGDHEELKVLVVMKDRTDVLAMDKELNHQAVTLAVRHQTVVSSLRDLAASSQQDILSELNLRQADKAAGGVRGFTPHWIVNSIVLVADVAAIREIAARDDVEIVEPDLEIELIEPVMTKIVDGMDLAQPQVGFLAPGVDMVNAPRVWHELGFDGTGTIVANMDSGVDFNHDLLRDKWRGNFAPASECWRDHAYVGSPDIPIDLHGHGTHTMGTITGVGEEDTLGVAPGALWIASNAIYSDNSIFDNAVIAGFEFFADPDGNPATHEDVPDVVNNSWGVTPNPGYGYVPCDSRWWDAIDHCEAAGVVVTWAAGNEGPDGGTIRSPGDRAASPTNCFTVGSVGFAIPYIVSEFSSRGPSACGGEYEIKPEVVAPGEDIISTLPGNNFGYMSGTSMASPHVAGIVALMRQANPDIDVTDIKQILMDTAIDVHIPGEDNQSGHGFVDAYAAVMAALTDVAVIEGTVTDLATGLPVQDVQVQRAGYSTTYLTDANGYYHLDVRSGFNEIDFSKFSYNPQTHSLDLEVGETYVLDIVLEQRPTGTVSGTVYGPDGEPVNRAEVYAQDIPGDPYTTGSDGYYEIELPIFDEANYEIVARALDLAYVVSYIGLPESRVVDIHLPYIIAEGFETGTLGSFPWQTGGQEPMAVDYEEAYEGIFSVRSGAIGDGDTSELSLNYNVVGDGELSFYVKTESEEGYDGLIFYIDGVYQASWSGEMDWNRFSLPVSTGQHTFKWVYSKDYAVSILRDAAWVDRIEFPGTGVQPVPRIALDQVNISMGLNSPAADSADLTVSNTGGYRLDFSTQISAFPVNQAVAGGDLVEKTPAELFGQGVISRDEKSADVPWATVTPDASWVHPGAARILEITFDSEGMENGVYYALLEIMSNDPIEPVKTVPLILTVGGISGVDDSVLPARVNLTGAVPNPFNPQTHISYSLPLAGEVTLRIYDVSGRLIRDLASGPRSAGQHTELWNGKDQGGQDVASGVYFARLNAGGQMQMKSMLLLR